MKPEPKPFKTTKDWCTSNASGFLSPSGGSCISRTLGRRPSQTSTTTRFRIPGIQVCVRWTDVVDSILIEIQETIIQELADPRLEGTFCLVAHGGYGRRDLAPFSDIDLMLLHSPQVATAIVPFARRLSQMIVDTGLLLGFSMRTTKQALQLSWRDPIIYTTLVESRLLAGSQELFDRFANAFRLGAMRRCNRIINAWSKRVWKNVASTAKRSICCSRMSSVRGADFAISSWFAGLVSPAMENPIQNN